MALSTLQLWTTGPSTNKHPNSTNTYFWTACKTHKLHIQNSALTFKFNNGCKIKITRSMNDQGLVCWVDCNQKLTDAFKNLRVWRTAEKILNNFQMKTGDRRRKWHIFCLDFLQKKRKDASDRTGAKSLKISCRFSSLWLVNCTKRWSEHSTRRLSFIWEVIKFSNYWSDKLVCVSKLAECFQILWLDESSRSELVSWLLRWGEKSLYVSLDGLNLKLSFRLPGSQAKEHLTHRLVQVDEY